MKALFNLLIALITVASVTSCSLLSAAGLSSQGQPVKQVDQDLGSTEDTSGTKESAARIDHSQWDLLLKKHVTDDGLVDYRGFQQDQGSLGTYLNMLSENPPTEDWTVQELLAYYINTYNAYTVNLILNNYPVASIKDINGPWTRGIVPVGNKNLSLGGIENGILRKMNEPRIHFAINCASISCPKLLNEAFVAHRIHEQLERVTSEFILSDKNDLDSEKPRLSSIFDWYARDFEIKGEQNVIGYINLYADVRISSDAELGYKEYNWNLNEKR